MKNERMRMERHLRSELLGTRWTSIRRSPSFDVAETATSRNCTGGWFDTYLEIRFGPPGRRAEGASSTVTPP